MTSFPFPKHSVNTRESESKRESLAVAEIEVIKSKFEIAL